VKTITVLNGKLAPLKAAVRRLASDRRGVAAVEFAFIAPVLLALYFLTMEVSQAIETNKKVSRVGSMVADLVTQQSGTIARSELEAIMQIGGAIVQPYNRSDPKITVTGIYITDESTPKAQVQWSRKLQDGSFATGAVKNSIATIPESLRIRDTFLVQVDSALDYRPVITWTADKKAAMGLTAAFDRINMNETYYLRPRMSPRIDCTGC
jgi:Flp pilus assembly protein TadG